MRQILLRLCHLSKGTNAYVDVGSLTALPQGDSNDAIFDYFKNKEVRKVFVDLCSLLDSKK